jgi:hypothetical protein
VFIRAIIFALILTTSILNAQQSTKYERKSISYINALLITDSDYNLNEERSDYFSTKIEDALRMERFDYNPLMGNISNNLKTHMRSATSLNEMSDLIESNIIDEIESILKDNLEQRAAGYVSSEELSSFAVDKAKTLGITAVEMEKLLNSAYIYFPVMTDYEETIDDDNGSVTVSIHGSVLWYRVILSGESTHIELINENESSFSMGFGSIDDCDNDYEVESAITVAFRSAVDNFAKNIIVATRKLSEFKLKSVIKEADFNSVSFNMGTREGIRLNDRFIVSRYVEGEAGITEEKAGFIEVSNVGFNGYGYNNLLDAPIELTKARIVRGFQLEEGMSVSEFPRLGLNIGIGMMSYDVEYKKTDSNRYLINVENSHSKPGFGAKLSLNYNTAPISGISHLYALIEGGFGFVDIDAIGGDGEDVSPGIYQTFSGGMMKKLCFRSLSVPLKAMIGVQILDFEAGWPLFGGGWVEAVQLRNLNIGFTFGTGVEFALGPASSIAMDIDWRAYTASDSWDLIRTTHLDEDDVDWLNDFPGPSVNASGVVIGVSFIYMPPSMPFDLGSYIVNKIME